MMPRTFLYAAFALVASTCSAAEDRELSGVNLCAAYDIVVPRIADGQDNCVCEGRSLECNFEEICDIDNTCASLEMDIDFATEGEESIVYKASYADDAFDDVVLTLDVTADIETDGIQGCSATMGDETCTCDACASGRGVEISCSSGATDGCEQIDVKNFERYVPFFGASISSKVASAEAADSASATATTTVAAAVALFGYAMTL